MTPGAAHAAAWTTPALFALVTARVASGHAEAAWLVILLVTAPLVALLRPAVVLGLDPVTRLVTLVVGALVVWANLVVFADVAATLGGARWQGAVLAAALTLLVTMWPAADRARAAMLGAGLACVLVAVVAAAVTTGHPPWSAWTGVASRAAFVFPEHGATARFTRATTLEFTEVHRVVALGAAAVRVTEQEGTGTVVREWLVSENEAVMLRPGDRLALPAGAHVRFEAGKRVPGAPPSGAQWADAPSRRTVDALLAATGLAVTLLGGAAALVPRSTRASAAVLPLAVAWVAVCCGIYTADLAPELTLADAPVAGLLRVARALPQAGAAALVSVIACAGLLALFIAAAQALRPRVTEAARASAPAVWTAIFALAAVGAVWTVDAARVLLAALGLAASAWAAPLFGAGDGKHRKGWTAAWMGSIAGALAFGALAALAARLPDWAGGIGDYPAVVAAPVGWAVAVTARRPSARKAGGTARSPSATSGP
jgi:hypothetical protein